VSGKGGVLQILFFFLLNTADYGCEKEAGFLKIPPFFISNDLRNLIFFSDEN